MPGRPPRLLITGTICRKALPLPFASVTVPLWARSGTITRSRAPSG